MPKQSGPESPTQVNTPGYIMFLPDKIYCRVPWLVIILIFLCYIFHTYAWSGYWNTNEYSRMFLTRALVDYQKFEIDDIIIFHNTQDKSFHNGHFYTNKAPGTSLLAAPVYLLIRFLERGFGFLLSEEKLLYLIKTVCVSLPSAVFLFVLFKFWGGIAPLPSLRQAFLIAYALGTLAWSYSSLFYGHQLAGICLFLAFRFIFQAKKSTGEYKLAFTAGIFCGGAFLIEYPTLLISLLLFVYLLTVFKDFKAPFLFFCGAAVLGGVTLFYHGKCFGGPFQFPYYFETYPQFALAHSRGIAGVTGPRLGPLVKLLISPFRGIFFYSPFLIFAPAGFYRMIREREWRKEGWLFIAISVVYFLFLSGFSDWEGGWSMGPRHLIPLLPFWITAIVFLFGKAEKKTGSRLVVIVTPLILVSVVFMFMGTSVFPYFPKEFKNPLYELSRLFILEGRVAPNISQLVGWSGIFSLLPLVVMIIILLVILVYDLSYLFSRSAAGRLLFSLLCLFLAAALLFLWDIWAYHRSANSPAEELKLQKIQRQRIISYMEKNPADKKGGSDT